MGFTGFPGGIFPQILSLAQLIRKRLVFRSSRAQERSSGDVLRSAFFAPKKHLWFLNDLNWDLGGGRKHPWESSALVRSLPDPSTVVGGSKLPKPARGTAEKQEAKLKGEGISGEGLGGVPECGVGHVEMPQRYQKKASLHSELDLGSTDAMGDTRDDSYRRYIYRQTAVGDAIDGKGDFTGFYLQLESQEAGDKLLVCRQYVIPSICPKPNFFLPPATMCWGQRGYSSSCTHRVPKSWCSPTL